MDNYREVDLLPVKGVGQSGTETIDIAVDEPITALYVYMRVKNGAVTADEAPPARCIDKIEIVDGGKVYWSTDGPEAVAVAAYETGKWPAASYQEHADYGQFISIPLLFGRYIGDEEFMFSPSKLLNPQLKITWTYNAKHTTTGYQLGVRVKAMQGVAPSNKALMVKNIRTYTATIAGIEPTDLPVDLDYRKLYTHSYLAANYWSAVLTHFKLDCDVGKLIVFDLTAMRYLDHIKEMFPHIELNQNVMLDNGVWKEGWLANIEDCSVNVSAEGKFCNAWSMTSGKYMQWACLDDGTVQNDEAANIRIRGFLPHAVTAYQFGRPQDPASWFKASKYGQVKLQLTGGTVGGTASILLQRPTPLP